MNDFVSIFVGVPQSRYAALAILIAIVVVSLVILFNNETVPLGQKFGFVFLIFLVSLPGLALSLFQLTCIVTGSGFKNKRWWCSAYAWIISAIMIFYSVLLVFAAVMSITAPKPHTYSRKLTPQQFSGLMQNANSYAANTMANTPGEATHTGVNVPQNTPVSNMYPNNQNPMKTAVGPMYSANPMSPPYGNFEHFTDSKTKSVTDPKTKQVATFESNGKVQGGASVPGPYPGSNVPTLSYAPGASLNGNVLPVPKAPSVETFYSPAKFTEGPTQKHPESVHSEYKM